MRIFIFRETELRNLTPNIVNTTGVGGTESSVVLLASELSKMGHTVRVCCPCVSGRYNNVDYISFQSYGLAKLYISLFNPDILIVSGNPRIFIDGPIDNKRTFFWHQNHPDELCNFPMREILKIPGMSFVFPSPEAACYGQDYYKSKQVFGIYNAIRDQFFNVPKVEKKDEIVYVGSLTRAKGVLELLKIAKGLPWPVRICGDFNMYGFVDEPYKKACEPYLNDVEMMGSLPPDKLAMTVARAKICVVNPLVGNKETCCVSALEAMAVGTFVLMGGNSWIDSIIQHGGIIYKSDLLKTINDLIKDGGYNINGNYWAKNITWSNMAKEWEKLWIN